MQLNTITELLNIPNFRVSHMTYRTNDRLEMILEHTEQAAPICSGCGNVHNSTIHSMAMVVVQDLPIAGKRVFLHVPKRKSRCIEDGRIRVEELENFDFHEEPLFDEYEDDKKTFDAFLKSNWDF